MKIGTVNIDWFKKSEATRKLIIDEISAQDFDFLVATENIQSFIFNDQYFAYHSEPIPTNGMFQHLNYGEYLKGETPIRTSIYSKQESIQKIETLDPYTSICQKFKVGELDICVYGTIIGTYGIKYQEEIARQELNNFKADIKNILSNNINVIITGDFNTSFIELEKRQLATIKSREEIIYFTNSLHIHRTTAAITNNIDHIFISQDLDKVTQAQESTFMTNSLNDEPHRGIILDVKFK